MSEVAALPGRALRRTRRDAGVVKLLERDRELLRLIAEQFALSLPQLGKLIRRSPETARTLRDRWQRAGWVASGQLLGGGSVYVWLTRRGSRAAGIDYKLWRPNPGMLAHIAAVSDVRLLLEHERRLGVWICERALAQQYPSRSTQRPHLPDGVLQTERGRIAVEVELTLKSRSRRGAIVSELSRCYDEVWYFASPACAPALRELAHGTPRQNVRVDDYPLASERSDR
jgi:hypothetical protein